MAKHKRIKVVTKTEYVPSPINPTNQAYWKGFNEGRDHERKIAIEYFITKIEALRNVEGVGEKTFNKILEYVNKEWG